jgi:hypothetical protein
MGVSTVVATAPNKIASAVEGLSPKKYGPADMTDSTARQSRSPASMISSSRCLRIPCVQSIFFHLPAYHGCGERTDESGHGLELSRMLPAFVSHEVGVDGNKGIMLFQRALHEQRDCAL